MIFTFLPGFPSGPPWKVKKTTPTRRGVKLLASSPRLRLHFRTNAVAHQLRLLPLVLPSRPSATDRQTIRNVRSPALVRESKASATYPHIEKTRGYDLKSCEGKPRAGFESRLGYLCIAMHRDATRREEGQVPNGIWPVASLFNDVFSAIQCQPCRTPCGVFGTNVGIFG